MLEQVVLYSMCKKKGNNLITPELLLITSIHKPSAENLFFA